MKEKAKSSYQHLTEKYHHAAVECEQKDKRIKELERKIVSLDGENNRLYQQACKAEEELLKYKAEPKIERRCETCRHTSLPVGSEKCIKCWKTGKLPNWQPKEDPKPEPVYTKFTKEELVSIVGKTIVNSTNPNRSSVVTGTDGDGNVFLGRDLLSNQNLVRYWLLDGKPCGKEQK